VSAALPSLAAAGDDSREHLSILTKRDIETAKRSASSHRCRRVQKDFSSGGHRVGLWGKSAFRRYSAARTAGIERRLKWKLEKTISLLTTRG
jgi:hypothetical protein